MWNSCLQLMNKGAITFDYGNNIRAQGNRSRSLKNQHFDFPGFSPVCARIYPSTYFAKEKVHFRWAALSGDPEDIRVTDDVMMQLFPENKGHDTLDKNGARKKLLSRDCLHAFAG